MTDHWCDLLGTQDTPVDVERRLTAVERRLASQESALDVQLGMHGAEVVRDIADQEDTRQLIELLKEERRALLAELDDAHGPQSGVSLGRTAEGLD